MYPIQLWENKMIFNFDEQAKKVIATIEKAKVLNNMNSRCFFAITLFAHAIPFT